MSNRIGRAVIGKENSTTNGPNKAKQSNGEVKKRTFGTNISNQGSQLSNKKELTAKQGQAKTKAVVAPKPSKVGRDQSKETALNPFPGSDSGS